MPIVNSTFSSLAALEAAATALNSHFSLASTLEWAQAAYDRINFYTAASYSTLTSTQVNGTLTNGDGFATTGTNLLGYPYTVTRLDYQFQGAAIAISEYGAISKASAVSTKTGYINRIDAVTNGFGNVTVLGHDDVTLTGDGTISSVTWQKGGATLAATGSLSAYVQVGADNFYHATVSGSYTNANISYGGQTLSISGMNFDVNGVLTTAAATLADILAGNDEVNGSTGAEALFGYGGADSISGFAGNDTLEGADGNDTLDGGQGNDTLNGGLGFDSLIGGDGNDELRGADQGDTLVGGLGDDLLGGGKGLDYLDGGDGNDTLIGGLGIDTLIGGNGTDIADYSGALDNIVVSLAVTTAQFVSANQGTDILAGIEGLIGGLFNDSLTGDGGANELTGGGGNDTMVGNDGFDTLTGGDGNDSLSGMNQGDVINGGNGNDFLGGGKGLDILDGGADNDTLQGGLGTDTLTGGSGADAFAFASALDGTSNVDTITDFVSGADVILLSNAIFAGVGSIGTTVGLTANLLYNAATGALSYDADGAGGGAALNFAILGVGTHPASLGNDFFIIA